SASFLSFLSVYAALRPRDSVPTRRSSDLQRYQITYAQYFFQATCFSRCADDLFYGLFTKKFVCHTGNCWFRLTTNGSNIKKNMLDRKSTRLNSSHVKISYAVFCLKKKQET